MRCLNAPAYLVVTTNERDTSLFTKNNESDYWTGFTPTVAVNEPYGALVPLGDLRDPLLATAINHMNGLTGGRQAASPDLTVGSSDDFKPGANNMFITKPIR